MKIKTALIVSISLLAIGFSAVGRYNAASLANMASIPTQENNSEDIYTAEEFDISTDDTYIKAQNVAHAVSEIEGIEKVSVIITGNSAIVGIEIIGELTDSKLIELKKKAESRARAAETSLDHVAVTAGAELIKRIERIADFSWTPEYNNETDNQPVLEREKIINSLTPAL